MTSFSTSHHLKKKQDTVVFLTALSETLYLKISTSDSRSRLLFKPHLLDCHKWMVTEMKTKIIIIIILNLIIVIENL
jgi:hypothetical protein